MAIYTTYTINQGNHEINGTRFGLSGTNIKFMFKLLPSCVYDATTVVPGWNKLWGFTTTDIHGNSARIGWRIKEGTNKFLLCSYSYVNKVRIDTPFTGIEIDPNQEVLGEIKWQNNNYVIGVNGTFIYTPQPKKPSFLTFQCYPYFGGESVAPHTMQIQIKKL